MVSREQADQLYHEWVAAHLRGETPSAQPKRRNKLDLQGIDMKAANKGVPAKIVSGSLLHIASSLLQFEESRVRDEPGPRRQGSICREVFDQRAAYAKEILQFITKRYGQGAAGRMMLADLSMDDVEAYNRAIVKSGYSSSQVTKRLQFVKAVIDRAGRPEHGGQVLGWNWDARDVHHGKPARKRLLPSLAQLKLLLSNCSPRETAMVWMAIGCGFGQRDLASVRVGQIDKKSYDLRRGKTGIERYGDTPPLVQRRQLLSHASFCPTIGVHFRLPLVHETSDSVHQWWSKLIKRFEEPCKGVGGFYTLRHLGATEFGSRDGCSIGAMKRWLGHSASSDMADVYMKPVSPENRPVIEWVRTALRTGKVELRKNAK